MATWASSTMVLDRVGERTPMTQAEINELIEQSEEYFSMLMKYRGFMDGTKAWNQVKYRALTDAVCSRVALLIIGATSLSWQTLDQAAMAANINSDLLAEAKALLSDQDYVEYLKAL